MEPELETDDEGDEAADHDHVAVETKPDFVVAKEQAGKGEEESEEDQGRVDQAA